MNSLLGEWGKLVEEKTELKLAMAKIMKQVEERRNRHRDRA